MSKTLGRNFWSQRGRENRYGRDGGRLRWWWVCGVMLLLVVGVGCADPVQRYRVLSLFFEGVPRPAGVEASAEELEEERLEAEREGRVVEGVAATQPEAATVEKVYVYHKPYEDRRCFACHDQTGGGNVASANAQTCRQCHADHLDFKFDDWVHGPVVMGQCGLCHESHKSEHGGLLKGAEPGLCTDCHGSQFVAESAFHASLKDLKCSRCHDPHASGNRKLLADARTYALRHKDGMVLKGHVSWGPGDCGKCHSTGESNKLKGSVDTVCWTCHAKERDVVVKALGATTQVAATQAIATTQEAVAQVVTTQVATTQEGEKVGGQVGGGEGKATGRGLKAGELHPPVAEGRCTACHNPHGSIRPHLVKELGEGLCVSCHDLGKLGANHPKVVRVDCAICHAGHRSGMKHLLREEFRGVGKDGADKASGAEVKSGLSGEASGGVGGGTSGEASGGQSGEKSGGVGR